MHESADWYNAKLMAVMGANLNMTRTPDCHFAAEAKRLTTADGKTVLVAMVYDVLMAQYGVPRGLPGDYPANYDDESAPYTPAWSEKYTGQDRALVIRFAREWARTAELTKGKCLIIIGAGVNHWYHANVMYRAGIHALMFCGCVGVGGLAHYVGQEKLAPMESWSSIAFARDWVPAIRLQHAPSWHYVNTDQLRYEKFTDHYTVPIHPSPSGRGAGVREIRWRAAKRWTSRSAP